MREHKYRIYIKSLNTIEDVKRLIFGDRTETIGQVVEVETYNGDKYFYLDKLEEVKLLEWTGLKDKNGDCIYEGDVVEYFTMFGFDCENEDYYNSRTKQKTRGVVRYEDGSYHPREYYNQIDDGYYSVRLFDFEIIGNKYKNKELLN